MEIKLYSAPDGEIIDPCDCVAQSHGNLTAASPITSIIPAPGTFVVRMLKQSGVTTGGIHLPEQQSEAPNQAIVVFAGESTYNKGITFMPKVGDRISMKRFGFSEVLVNSETLRQVGANDILGILL